MSRRGVFDPVQSRGGFTKKGLLVVLVVLAVLTALLVKGILVARESASSMSCTNNMKQIGLALYNYSQANRAFPPGTICTIDPVQPGNQCDVLHEAAQTGEGFLGTSILFRVMPYIEGDSPYIRWDRSKGISSTDPNRGRDYSNFSLASCDVWGFYCPSRRYELCPEDKPMMLSPAWKGGGTDYGGCAGRHAAFTLDTGYNICDASMLYKPTYSDNRRKRHRGPALGHLRTGEHQHHARRNHRWRVKHHNDRGTTADQQHGTDKQGRLGHRRPGNVVHHRRDVQPNRWQADLRRLAGKGQADEQHLLRLARQRPRRRRPLRHGRQLR